MTRQIWIYGLSLLFSAMGLMLAWINFAPELRGLDIEGRMDQIGSGAETVLGFWWLPFANCTIQFLAFRIFTKLSGERYVGIIWFAWFIAYWAYLLSRH